MPTKLLYYENPYISSFQASVTECVPEGKNFAIQLDVTAFFPNAGGQPCDFGKIAEANVVDVMQKGEKIIHLTDKCCGVGETVNCEIDWGRRFFFMQHHTAEHIMSGLAHRLYGLSNVGFHMNCEMVTIDYDKELSIAQMEELELQINKIIFKNLPVSPYFPTDNELKSLEYRSKKELSENIRIVKIADVDVCACCALHLQSTGEAGLVKLLNLQRYKKGSRLNLICGEAALYDYRQKDKSIASISQLFSVKQTEVVGAVEKLVKRSEEDKLYASKLRGELFKLRSKDYKTEDETACIFENDLTSDELKQFALVLSDCRKGINAVFSGNDNDGYKYAISCAKYDMRPMSKELNEKLNGRGGGNAVLIQGELNSCRQKIEAYFENLNETT